ACFMGDLDPDVRRQASAVLLKYGPADRAALRPILANLVHQSFRSTKQPQPMPEPTLLTALGHIAPTDPATVNRIADFVLGGNPASGAAAVFALGSIGPPARAKLDLVLAGLEDVEAAVRQKVIAALPRIDPAGTKAVPFLVAHLQQPPAVGRLEAV